MSTATRTTDHNLFTRESSGRQARVFEILRRYCANGRHLREGKTGAKATRFEARASEAKAVTPSLAPPPLVAAPPSIDFISDVICPWCFIGLHRLEAALAEENAENVTITFHPFQLDPTIPVEGADLRERLADKIGDPQPLFHRIEAEARESGLVLDFTKVRRSANTLKAHSLITRAHDKGTQHTLARALFSAYFQEGKDIGQDSVLVAIASRHGFERSEAEGILQDDAALAFTRAEAEAMSSQGIRGVPFTIFGGKLAVSGAQPVDAFRQVFRRARDA
jgi:predicted DsbA family dithiol-disulfide isomerase